MYQLGTWTFAFGLLTVLPINLLAQQSNPPVVQASTNDVAATVNGEVIRESAVQRELKFAAPQDVAKLRPAIVNNLVDLALIDQYLRAAKVEAAPAEVEGRFKKMQEEAKTQGNMDLKQLLEKLGVSEEELRNLLTADLRWENFVKSQADDAKLEQFFNGNKVMFDGSEVHGRHVLIAVKADAPAAEKQAAQAKLAGLKNDILKRAAEMATKNDPKTDPAKAKIENLESAFAEVASKESDCPSKKNGGDLGFFPRIGVMVENFSAAAFALEPGAMTEIIETQFGYHLIVCVDKKAGKADLKFADMKEQVREVYGERLKMVMVPQLRQRAQITIGGVATK
jgi:peptidyl-prolyl cis-trans isomerase C